MMNSNIFQNGNILISVFTLAILFSFIFSTPFVSASGSDEPIDLQISEEYPKRVFDGEMYRVNVNIQNLTQDQAFERVKLTGNISYIFEDNLGPIVKSLNEENFPDELRLMYEERDIFLFDNVEVEEVEEDEKWRLEGPEGRYTHVLKKNGEKLNLSTSADIRSYGIGPIQAGGSLTQQLRVPPEIYEMGKNEVKLSLETRNGSKVSNEIGFRVLDETKPVEPFVLETNSPISEGQNLEVLLGVYAASDSVVSDLRVKPLSDNVFPTGYGVGEEMKNLPVQDVNQSDFQGVLTGGSDESESGPGVSTGETGTERMVIGRQLYFEGENLSGDEPLTFEVEYNLETKSVTEEIKVDYEIEDPSLNLIQVERLEVEEGKSGVIPLEISNEMDTKVDAVNVHPVGNYEVYPKSRPMGTLDPEDFRRLDFRLHPENIEDGQTLTFQMEYEISGDTYTVSEDVVVNVKDEETNILSIVITVLVVLAVIVAAIHHWRPEVIPWSF